MPNPGTMLCREDARRELVLSSSRNGIDYIEVSSESLATQRLLRVRFLKPLTGDDLSGHPELFRVEGGTRITGVKVLAVRPENGHLIVEVDRPGDFSTYTLIINHGSMDPIYGRCNFSFKAGCPSPFDCRKRVATSPEAYEHPVIDYMAKDYASFRQALLDFASTRVPDWEERHEADLGIALAELLAYAGDRLSYYQDAVANEAHLEIARRRISVRRHARLIDYRMHDGASARVFLHVATEAEHVIPAETPAATRIVRPLGDSIPGAVIPGEHRKAAEDAAEGVFETMYSARIHPRLNELRIHTWANEGCCLPSGATSAELVGDVAFDETQDGASGSRGETWRLQPGDFLLFEEVVGPATGLEADADLTHRQVVRLKSVGTTEDPLAGFVTCVAWDAEDGLTFPLCVSAIADRGAGSYVPAVSVARGNLILADHGRRVLNEEHTGPEEPTHEILRRAHRIHLKEGPLSFRVPLPPEPAGRMPATRLFDVDPGATIPAIPNLVVPGTPNDWEPRKSLFDSDAFDRHFVVETDNDGRAQIRFGDDHHGQAPPDKSLISVTYRIGVGRAGNVGADTIAHLIGTSDMPGVLSVRNPLSAWGGIDPEPISVVKAIAPAAIRSEMLRAVTEKDYEHVAEKHPLVDKAVATFRWTGSWHTVLITIDPRGRTDIPSREQAEVADWIRRFAQAGYDIEIDPPIYVPLEIALEIGVDPAHFRAHVEEAIAEALSDCAIRDRTVGFFHPDRFTFGQPLYLSDLCAAVERVEGVESVVVTKLKPFAGSAGQELVQGFVAAGRLEILRLDNDPNYPENGVLELTMRGGK
jgi:hypothetical protein